MTSLRCHRHGDLEWFAAAGQGWRAVFSTRCGGASSGAFGTLNMSEAVGDDPQLVYENHRRLAAAAGYPAECVVMGRQVHGTAIREVGRKDRGRGAAPGRAALPDTDGLLTGDPEVPLMVSVADCVPVVLAATSPDGTPTVAIVHAGWRGLLAAMPARGVLRLRPHGEIAAAIVGPSIGPCCFSVGDDVGRAFEERYPGSWRRGRVDLWAVGARQLANAGVPASHITVARVCTSCDDRFFSHRRDAGRTGRQAGVVWIEAPSRRS